MNAISKNTFFEQLKKYAPQIVDKHGEFAYNLAYAISKLIPNHIDTKMFTQRYGLFGLSSKFIKEARSLGFISGNEKALSSISSDPRLLIAVKNNIAIAGNIISHIISYCDALFFKPSDSLSEFICAVAFVIHSPEKAAQWASDFKTLDKNAIVYKIYEKLNNDQEAQVAIAVRHHTDVTDTLIKAESENILTRSAEKVKEGISFVKWNVLKWILLGLALIILLLYFLGRMSKTEVGKVALSIVPQTRALKASGIF